MLVLALEFSRGNTAHAWAGHHRWTSKRPARTPPDRGTHGASGPPAQQAGSEPGLEEPKGSTRKAGRTNPPADTPEGTSPGSTRGPFPQNGIVRVGQLPQGPVRDRRAQFAVQRTANQRRPIICRYTRATE
jgi:hypothetical protein